MSDKDKKDDDKEITDALKSTDDIQAQLKLLEFSMGELKKIIGDFGKGLNPKVSKELRRVLTEADKTPDMAKLEGSKAEEWAQKIMEQISSGKK